MPLRAWLSRSDAQPGAPGLRALQVSASEWPRLADDVAAAGGFLAALWASGQRPGEGCVRVVYCVERLGVVASLTPLDAGTPFPGIEDIFPAAARMQRAVADLSGARSTAADTRPWLRHAAWPAGYRPLIDAAAVAAGEESAVDAYEFVRVEGEGVHEIPVGPVHAGIIEPGHFRFSVVGEKVLRLEERLGYVHKGVERRFTEFRALDGHRLAARVSGDSAVAFSWAYCQALEALCDCVISRRAACLRALCLEIERVQNHLGDLGALGNDAGFAFGLAQFSRLKEELLRAVECALGRRYLIDAIVPGGMHVDLEREASAALRRCVTEVAAETRKLRDIYDAHSGLRDRFVGAGRVTPDLARRLGLVGLAGRASGQPFDARVDIPAPPFDELCPNRTTRTDGDVAARVAIRFEELLESCRIIAHLLEDLPDGALRVTAGSPAPDRLAVGLIEGWRGPVLVALEVGHDGMIDRCHPHDPSWQNWPALEHAVIDNIVPDFPLINKSFNLSYSGHDL